MKLINLLENIPFPLQKIQESPVAVPVVERLRKLVHEVKSRAYVPYSERPEAVVLLLSDGAWIPGVRVESASFSLTIPALLNAWTTAVALGRRDIVAAAFSGKIGADVRAFTEGLDVTLNQVAEDMLMARDAPLPEIKAPLAPFYEARVADADRGVHIARQAARRAWAPYSHFPVGCLLQLQDGRYIPGVNVEHPDWTRTLCAERNALGTALSYGLRPTSWKALLLSCVKDEQGTPCGACRQLLVEHAPSLAVWMDRGDEHPPQQLMAVSLLPAFFVL